MTTHISNHFTKEIDFETEHYHDVQKRISPGDVEEEPAKFSYETFPQKSLEKYQCVQNKFLEVQNRSVIVALEKWVEIDAIRIFQF